MTRRSVVLSLAAAATCSAQTAPVEQPAPPRQQQPDSVRKLELVDVVVGEFSTSLILPKDFVFVAGMPVFLSFRVSGYEVDPELGYVSLDYSVEIFDAAGKAFEKPIAGRYSRRLPTEETPLLPLIRAKTMVPEYIYPGDATFRVKLTDRRSKHTASAEGTIPIRSDLPKTSGAFEILGLKLYRSEIDETEITEPVFKPGEAIWTRFLLASFQWNEGGYNLRYGLSVLGKDGRVVLSVPDAAAESNRSEYLRSYVPGIASVRLERAARPGMYTLAIVAVDNVAKTEAKLITKFQIVDGKQAENIRGVKPLP